MIYHSVMKWKWYICNWAHVLAYDVLLSHLMQVEHNFLADDVLLFHFVKSEHMSLADDGYFLSK
jgi:hypothetical protein